MICALLIEAQFGAWAGSGDRSRHALVTSNDYLPDKLKASASEVSAVGRSIVDLPLTCLESGAGKKVIKVRSPLWWGYGSPADVLYKEMWDIYIGKNRYEAKLRPGGTQFCMNSHA
jgi:hypothetical protein